MLKSCAFIGSRLSPPSHSSLAFLKPSLWSALAACTFKSLPTRPEAERIFSGLRAYLEGLRRADMRSNSETTDCGLPSRRANSWCVMFARCRAAARADDFVVLTSFPTEAQADQHCRDGYGCVGEPSDRDYDLKDDLGFGRMNSGPYVCRSETHRASTKATRNGQ